MRIVNGELKFLDRRRLCGYGLHYFSLSTLVLATSGLVYADVVPGPLPDNSLYALFTSQGTTTFNTMTGEVTYTGVVQAVQFPNQVLSFSDPLVTDGAIMTVDEFFTGTSFSSLSTLDESAEFLNSLTQITVGGQLVYSEFEPEFEYLTTYTVPTGFDTDYQGTQEAVRSVDNFISSPFLASIPLHDSQFPPPTQTLVYDKNGILIPGARNDDPTKTTPEPGTFWLLGGVLAAFFSTARIKTELRVDKTIF
jgi:hypothetical protein